MRLLTNIACTFHPTINLLHMAHLQILQNLSHANTHILWNFCKIHRPYINYWVCTWLGPVLPYQLSGSQYASICNHHLWTSPRWGMLLDAKKDCLIWLISLIATGRFWGSSKRLWRWLPSHRWYDSNSNMGFIQGYLIDLNLDFFQAAGPSDNTTDAGGAYQQPRSGKGNQGGTNRIKWNKTDLWFFERWKKEIINILRINFFVDLNNSVMRRNHLLTIHLCSPWSPRCVHILRGFSPTRSRRCLWGHIPQLSKELPQLSKVSTKWSL